MASKKITAMPDWAGNQVSTDLITGVDLSASLANQNVKSTLNDLFAVITKNITDGAVRFEEFTAPALSGAGEGALYFDDTDKTFKGSRNGGAFDDLLFGSGSNKQVSVFTSSPDLVSGYAPFTYDSALERLYISDTVFSPTIEVSKTGTSPAYAKIFGGQGFASLGNWSVTAAAPAYLNFYRGANGPAYPTNGMDIGSIRFRPAVDASDTPTTVGGARIDVRATENATAGVGGGVGLTIFTAANGEVSDNPRFLINYLGAVMVGVNSATITTNTGAGTRTVLGELTTYDADAIHQIGNPTATDRKTLVIQAIAGQTKTLTEWQTSAGAFLFSIGAGGSLSFGGTTGIAVSATGQARVYYDSGLNQLRVSQNGGAYANLVNPLSPGGTTGSIQYNTGAGLIDGDTYFLWDSASATIQIGSAAVLSGKILLRNATNANTLTIQPGATGGNITFTLPVDTGTSGQFLQTNGSGVLSWATASGSGGLTVGTTTIASGVVGRVLYEATGNVLGEAAGITYQTGASPTLTATAQAASYVALRVNSAASPSVDVFQVSADNGTTTHFAVLSNGSPSAPWGTNSQRFGGSTVSVSGTPTNNHIFGTNNSITITGNWTSNVVIGGGLTWSASGGNITGNTFINVGSNVGNVLGGVTAVGSALGTAYSNWVSIGAIYNANSLSEGVAIGTGALAAYSQTIVLMGTPTAANQFVAGKSAAPMTDVFFGKGVTNATPTAYTINGTGGSGTNIAGAAINIFAGKGTGTGNPGTFSIQFARPGTTGSSLNTLSDSLLFSYTTDAIYQTYKIKTTTTAETDAAAIGVAWLDNTHATRTSVFSVQTVGNGSGLTIIAEFDLPTAAGDTGFAIYDLDNAAVERVSVGAADSGGTGFKVLRIPN